jgi:hypothetical protein
MYMILKELPLLFDVCGKKILYVINQRFRKGRRKKKKKSIKVII